MDRLDNYSISHQNNSIILRNVSLSDLINPTEANMIKRIGLALQVLLFLTIFIGNVSVLVGLLTRNIRNQMSLFIINLAVTDLFVALGGVVPQLIWEITVVFYAPTAICKLYKYISSAVTYASSFALVVLSVDRAEAVCRPLRVASSGLSSKTRARLLIGAAWVAAALFGLPGPLLAHKDYEGTEREACLLNFTKISPQVYLTSIAVSVFVLPACIIATCHVIMVATIWRASKLQTATFDGCPSHPVTLTRQTSNDVHLVQLEVTRKPRLAMPRYNRHKRSSTEGFLQKPKQPTHQNAGCIPRAKVKTVKMTCVIVSAYIICWCPFMVWNMLVTYGVMRRSAPQLMKYTPIVQHLVPLNSAANPIIFWIFNASTIRKSMHQPVRGPITQRTRLNT